MKEFAPKLIVPIVLTLLSIGLALGLTLLVTRIRTDRHEAEEPGLTPETI